MGQLSSGLLWTTFLSLRCFLVLTMTNNVDQLGSCQLHLSSTAVRCIRASHTTSSSTAADSNNAPWMARKPHQLLSPWL